MRILNEIISNTLFFLVIYNSFISFLKIIFSKHKNWDALARRASQVMLSLLHVLYQFLGLVQASTLIFPFENIRLIFYEILTNSTCAVPFTFLRTSTPHERSFDATVKCLAIESVLYCGRKFASRRGDNFFFFYSNCTNFLNLQSDNNDQCLFSNTSEY